MSSVVFLFRCGEAEARAEYYDENLYLPSNVINQLEEYDLDDIKPSLPEDELSTEEREELEWKRLIYGINQLIKSNWFNENKSALKVLKNVRDDATVLVQFDQSGNKTVKVIEPDTNDYDW